MDKKVIQALFTNICAKDGLRPIMNGVHFESERCYATDGHILVIYAEGKPELDGKTMLPDGTSIEGRFPNVDSVFPNEDAYGNKLNIDIKQLRDACQWQIKQENANANDRVVINGVGYNVRTLLRLLNVLLLVGDHHKIKFYNSDPSRCSVLIGTKLKCIIMPMQYEEDSIDAEREGEGFTCTFSYENFINDFVFNSWRKTNKQSNFSWLD